MSSMENIRKSMAVLNMYIGNLFIIKQYGSTVKVGILPKAMNAAYNVALKIVLETSYMTKITFAENSQFT